MNINLVKQLTNRLIELKAPSEMIGPLVLSLIDDGFLEGNSTLIAIDKNKQVCCKLLEKKLDLTIYEN